MSKVQQYHLASIAAWLSSTGISHHSLLLHIPSIHLSAVNSSPRPGIASSFSFHKLPVPECGGLVSRVLLAPKRAAGRFPLFSWFPRRHPCSCPAPRPPSHRELGPYLLPQEDLQALSQPPLAPTVHAWAWAGLPPGLVAFRFQIGRASCRERV